MRFLALATLIVALIIPDVALAQRGKGGGGGGGGGRGGGGGGGGGRPGNSNWSGGNWSGNRGGGNWNGGNWSGGNWNRGGYYGHDYHNHNDNWVPYVAFGLGALSGWGWGGYGGYGYGPGYYGYGSYDYPSYSYPSYSYDSYPRVSGYYDPQMVGSSGTSMSPSRVGLEIIVPDPNAQLLIQGEAMRTTGTRRLFVSPDLEQGKTYTYTITLKRNVNGRVEDDTRELDVQPGSVKRVDFSQPQVQTLPAPRSGSDRIPAQGESRPPAPVPPR